MIAAFALSGEAAHKSATAASQDYCGYGDRSVLIYIDRTTQYDDVDKELFVQGIGRIVASFEPGDRVIVHTIAGDYSESERAFDRCVPGCPDSGALGWFFDTCRPMQAQKDFTAFRFELAKGIRGMLDDLQSYEHSDIIRTIARVTQAMDGAGKSAGDARQLVQVFIFSDLLENSAHLPWPTVVQGSRDTLLKKLSSQDLLAQLDGARVTAFGIGRNHDPTRSPLSVTTEKRLRDFWTGFFMWSGAKDVYIGRRLE